MRDTSVVAVFAFLLWRTAVNAARRRLGRLREARYLLGAVVGGLYLYWWFFRALLRGRLRGGSGWAVAIPADVQAMILLGAAAALAWMAGLTWLLSRDAPRLHFLEAEVQFLAPAPLPRRALLHFVLLRSALALLVTALVMGLFMGGGLRDQWPRSVAALWVLLSTMHLHALGISFWNAASAERPEAVRRTLKTVRALVAVAFVLVLAAWLLDGARVLVDLARRGSLGGRAIVTALEPWAAGWVPRLLLLPFRAAVAPVLAPDAAAFLKALPLALGLLAAHCAWVVRINVRYEEAALEGARRHAQVRERLAGRRPAGHPLEGRRAVVPFALPGQGIPEVAVLWKNILARRRGRVRTSLLAWLAAWTVVLLGAAVAVGADPSRRDPIVVLTSLSLMTGAVGAALLLPLGYRNDFREDLEAAAVLRGWPLRPAGLAAAEIAAPLLGCVLAVEGLLGAVFAVQAGGRVGLAWNGVLPAAVARPDWKGLPPDWDVAAVVALALFLPALSATVLVVQNAAVLAFPGWFPPGPRRPGLEASGTRLLGFLGTMVLLIVVLLPAALLAVPVGYVAWRLVGPFCLVPAAAAACVPVWTVVALSLVLLGRLFQRFDVSMESWT